MDSIQRDSDKNMKKLYSFMNRNKKPVQEKFGWKNNDGNLITEENDIKRELRTCTMGNKKISAWKRKG